MLTHCLLILSPHEFDAKNICARIDAADAVLFAPAETPDFNRDGD